MKYYEWDEENKVYAIYDENQAIDICATVEEIDRKYPDAVSKELYDFMMEMEMEGDRPEPEPIKVTNPFKGRFLILKILCESERPLTIDEIAEKSDKLVELVRDFISKLIKDGFVQEKGDKYQPTDRGMMFFEALSSQEMIK